MIKKVFSPTGLFLKEYPFQRGLNIIFGRYSGSKEGRGINGIGKSSLVRIIDYLLLSDRASRHFASFSHNFLREEAHQAGLIFEVSGKEYFVLRTFNSNDPVKFGLDGEAGREYKVEELKTILCDLFFPIPSEDITYKGARYGSLMNFFIKDDLEHQSRVDPLNFVGGYNLSKPELVQYNFFLLGMPGKHVILFDDLNKDYTKSLKLIGSLKAKLLEDTGKSIEEYRAEHVVVEKRIDTLEQALKNKTFLEVYKDIEGLLVQKTAHINELLSRYDFLNTQLEKVKASYQFNEEVDVLRVSEIFKSVSQEFGDFVKKTLDEAINFRKDLVQNRRKFLSVREGSLTKEISSVLDSIADLEKERRKLYAKLGEKGALDSIENAYEQLISEKATLVKNTQLIENIESIESKVSRLNTRISQVKEEIEEGIRNYDHILSGLRLLFQEILDSAILMEEDAGTAFFDISPSGNRRRDSLPYDIKVSIPRADALGQSRLKIVAYDLLVFLNAFITERQLPNFLIHDGVYHGTSRRTVVNVLNFLNRKLREFPKAQYIVTFNEDELSERMEGCPDLEFHLSDVTRAEFSDAPEGMLFQRGFN